MRIQDSRIRIKRSTTASEVPTVPTSTDHTDGSWLATDIYKGEFFKNLVDGKLFTRFDSGIVELLSENSTTVWKTSGNTLSARGTFGSTSGNYGWNFKKNNVTLGGLEDTNEWFFGTTGKFTSTFFSGKSLGNTSSTYAYQWKNSSDTVLSWLQDDGILNAVGFNINGSLFARYSNGSAIFQMTPETPDKTGVGTDWMGIGRAAMYSATNPQRVVAIGGGTFLDATSWQDSVGLGFRAGFKNIDGSYLMYIGPEAGYYNENGDHQIMIGRGASPVSGATNLNGVIVIASGGVVRQSNTAVFGSNDSPISRYVFGRGESETTTFEDVIFTAHYPQNSSNQNAGGSLGFGPPSARGTGSSGDLKFYYSPAVASGTTLQTHVEAMRIKGSNGNIGLWGSSFGSGEKVMFIANATTVPSADPTGGGILYVESGALKYRGSSGTITTLATA